MCGFAGELSFGAPPDREAVRRASAALAHRGPDDSAEWAEGPVALAFRRLSILDLEGGAQPMREGPLALVFNGEIYNHPALRAELEASGARYRTRSDAESILRAWAKEGRAALGRLRGMFAVALWDSEARRLTLARDPLGMKPLYYARLGGRLLFASELRALVAAGVPDGTDPLGLFEYLSFGYVHAPRTALASVRKLEPGQWLEADEKGVRTGSFWLPPSGPPLALGADEAEARLSELLTKAVRSHLMSDVPVGAFLSGGVDSSLVAALMAEAGPVETFSIGFDGARRGLDESGHARRVAERLGTRHHELRLPADVLDRVEDMLSCLDEPVADSALLPTYLLAKHARGRVKVALTGEGADELFAGYPRYKALVAAGWARRLPGFLAEPALRLLRRRLGRLPGEGVEAWAESRRLSPRAGIYAFLGADLVREIERDDALAWLAPLRGRAGLDGALAYDLRTVLPEGLLMKVDKAAMRASLEARVPFLDLDLVEFALRLPPSLKIRFFKGKWLLRRLAARRLPRETAQRRKHGFWVPWEEWIRRANPAVDEALRGLSSELESSLLAKSLGDLRDGSPYEDPGLLFRFALYALWRGTLAR